MNRRYRGIDYGSYLQVLLEEFSTNRDICAAIEARISTLFTVVATLFAGALILLPQAFGPDTSLIFLALSIVFGLFGFGFSFSVKQIFSRQLYERQILRSKIEGLLQTALEDESITVLEWEQFNESALVTRVWLGRPINAIQSAGSSVFPVLASIGLMLTSVIMKLQSGSAWTPFELSLLIASIVLVLLLIMGWISTLIAYRLELRDHPLEPLTKVPNPTTNSARRSEKHGSIVPVQELEETMDASSHPQQRI